METFIVYLLKTGVWIGIFWLVYRLFLRKETFYCFNRYYLLAGLILPFVIPFVQLKYTVDIAVPVTSGMPVSLEQPLSTPAFDWFFVWILIYGCGIVAIAVRYLAGWRKIAALLALQPGRKTGPFHIVDSPGFQHPFSVFNYIFINSQATSDIAQAMILEHEQAHIRQRHWIDLALCNLGCLFQWFNPFVWLYIKAMKQNHEYLADQSVLQKGHSPAIYQAVLLGYTLNVHASALVHSFAHNGKASRFRMMKKAVSNPLRKATTLSVLPVLAVFLWAFAQPVYQFDSEITTPETTVAVTDTISIREQAIEITPAKETGKAKSQYTQPQYVHPQYTQPESLITRLPENVQVNGFKPMVTAPQKLLFKPTTEQDFNMKPETQVPVYPVAAASKEADPPLVLLDGMEVPFSMIKTMNPNTIESIRVLKDKTSISLYGEKGKNGVIVIQSKLNTNLQKVTK